MKNTKRISETDVQKISALAKIKLQKNETTQFENELSSILAYIEMLGKLETREGQKASMPSQSNVFREDESRPSLSAHDATSGSATAKDNYFVLPAVILRK